MGEETFEDIREPLERVLKIIHSDRSKFNPGVSNPKDLINVEKLDQAAGNHMFDDDPELYGISEEEGHDIREYFQGTGLGGRIWRDYLEVLHGEFPQYLDPERPLYIRDVDRARQKRGESPVNLPSSSISKDF